MWSAISPEKCYLRKEYCSVHVKKNMDTNFRCSLVTLFEVQFLGTGPTIKKDMRNFVVLDKSFMTAGERLAGLMQGPSMMPRNWISQN